MTRKETDFLKKELEARFTERLREGFIGQKVSAGVAETIKAVIKQVLSDYTIQNSNDVLSLLDVNVKTEGNVVSYSLSPKRGLSTADMERALDFLYPVVDMEDPAV